jgi:EmrB/QacA subfamily drug resistance transporter
VTARTDRLLLANAVMGQFLAGVASRIFIVSLPTIAGALDADIVAIAWAVIAYQLAGISLSVVFGRLGDVYGRYAIYGGGFAIMAVSSLFCGLAPTATALVVFRFVQGLGAAMLASATRVLAMEAMPERAAGRANGYMTMAFHGGLLIGPTLGGLVIDLASWRWTFFLLVPIAVTGVGLTVARARTARPPVARRASAAIDYAGAALLVVLTTLLTVLLDRRAAEMVGAVGKSLMAVGFAVALVLFVVHERRAPDPVVNLRLFRIRMFSLSVLSLLLVATSTSVLTFLMPFYLQDVLRLAPSAIGLIFLTAPVFTISLASVSGVITDRVGPRLPASAGILSTMAAFGIGAFLRVDSHWAPSVLMMVLFGLGAGFFNTPNQTAIVGSVPREYRGFATGMVQTLFGIGSLLGISLGGLLLTVAFRHYAGLGDARASADVPHAFVAAINVTFVACFALTALALATSVLRGGARIEAASTPAPPESHARDSAERGHRA